MLTITISNVFIKNDHNIKYTISILLVVDNEVIIYQF